MCYISIHNDIPIFLRRLRDHKPTSLEHTPPFQRTNITHAGQVPTSDSETAYNYLIAALRLREKYMARSLQSFAVITSQFLKNLEGTGGTLEELMESMHVEQKQGKPGSSESILWLRLCSLVIDRKLTHTEIEKKAETGNLHEIRYIKKVFCSQFTTCS